MLQNPDLKAFAQWHHKVDAPTYVKGPVAIMGDAAHAMTPWQGSGAGQAIEDAMILGALLGEAKEAQQINAAFKAYDQVRRPRTQQIVASSHEVGMVMTGRGACGLDVDKLAEDLQPRWAPILSLDLKDHKKAALDAMRSMV
jgi:salicylate hydroxylase